MVDEIIEDEIIVEADLTPEVVEEVVEPSEEKLVLLAEQEAEALRIEAERLAEIERQRRGKFEVDLKARYENLFDRNAAFHQNGISNPDLHFNQNILYNRDEFKALENMLIIENQDKLNKLAHESTAYIDNRANAYVQLDKMLLEGLAEQAAGSPAKLEEYLALRAEIKLNNPKPVA